MERHAFKFTAVLLAGGRSSRMGRDKALVPFEGRRLWEHQIDTLHATRPDELLISAATPEPYASSGFAVVLDTAPGLGPLAGIAAALRAAKCEMLLVLAIDLPRMRADFLGRLLEESADSGRGIVPQGEAWFEPLAAVYPRTCLDLAEEHLHGEDRSMQRFTRRAIEAGLMTPRRVDTDQIPLFRNVNEPRDLD